MRTLATGHGDLRLPAFLPDATRAVVRTLDAADLAECGADGLMVNALHLSSHPGTTVIAGLGGIHRFIRWTRPVASDSGGYQVFSLIRETVNLGSVSREGFTYRLAKGAKKQSLPPEKAIQKQFQIGADIMFCLDHCTHPAEDADVQRQSVEHTVEWARRCREEFDRRAARLEGTERPLLFAVVQGGDDPELRRICGERLVQIGFDGYGFGGWPIDRHGALVEMVEHVAGLLPSAAPKHALGIGKPENVVRGFQLGYGLFDCTLPTRDARHQRLYVFDEGWERARLRDSSFYHNLYLQDDKHRRDPGPVDEHCDCRCCQGYSRAYLHHLFAVRDPLGHRLATIHNLRFYARLMERLRMAAKADE
jgi:queuine tRNA-ribosyltransferase